MATPSPAVYNADKVPMAGGRHPIGATFRNMPVGWNELVIPGEKPPAGVLAYSGMGVDSKNGKVYLAGGGHYDSWDDAVYSLDLLNISGGWNRSYVPTFTGQAMSYSGSIESDTGMQYAKSILNEALYPGAILKDGVPWRPISRHTYQSVKWIESINRLMVGGGSTWSGFNERYWSNCWLNAPADGWLYNPANTTWEYLGSKLVDPSFDTSGSIMAYDSNRGVAYQSSGNGNANLTMRVWDTTTRKWQLKPGVAAGTVAGFRTLAVDTKRDRVVTAYNYASSPLALQAWYPDTNTWEAINATNIPLGDPSSGEGTMCYSPKTDTLFILGREVEGLWAFNCVTGTWEVVSCPCTGLLQTCGRLFYDNLRGALLVVYNDYANGIRVFAYRD